MNFIELTADEGFICVNINQIKVVRTYIGIDDNVLTVIDVGGIKPINVKETYDKVLSKINARLAGVNRL